MGAAGGLVAREATPEDFEPVARLLFEEFLAPLGDPASEAHKWLAARRRHPAERVFCVEDPSSSAPGGVIAAAGLTQTDLEGYEHLSPWLSAVVTDRRHRGRGAATALVEAICAAAAANGAPAIYAWTRLPGFFSDRGFERIGHTAQPTGRYRIMRRALTWPAEPEREAAGNAGAAAGRSAKSRI